MSKNFNFLSNMDFNPHRLCKKKIILKYIEQTEILMQ